MKRAPWILAASLGALALPWAACAGGEGGSGAGTSGAATTTTATTGDPCSLILVQDPCDDCITHRCCAALDACDVDMSCLDCFTGNTTDPAICGAGPTQAALGALLACAAKACAAVCAPAPPSCNPVSNQGCAAGSSCDKTFDPNLNPTFSCFAPPPPNTVALCGACDDKIAACAGGSTCVGGKCEKFCCDDGDCGSGVCQPLGAYGVGLCVSAASVDAGAPAPACDAPAASPSMGSCVMGLDAGAPPADAGAG